MSKQAQFNKHRVAGLLVAMGVVYGDIGTSPLYVMKAIITGQGGLADRTRRRTQRTFQS